MLVDEPPHDYSNLELRDLAAELLLAMMSSAPTDKISREDWWRRARVALRTGAERGTNFPEMVETMRKSLQIPVTIAKTARVISSISYELDRRDAWRDFKRICKRETEYIRVDAEAVRDQRRGDYQEQSADDVDFADPFGVDFDGAMGLPDNNEEA